MTHHNGPRRKIHRACTRPMLRTRSAARTVCSLLAWRSVSGLSMGLGSSRSSTNHAGASPHWEQLWAADGGLPKGTRFDVAGVSLTLAAELARRADAPPCAGRAALVPGCGRAYDALALAEHGQCHVLFLYASPVDVCGTDPPGHVYTGAAGEKGAASLQATRRSSRSMCRLRRATPRAPSSSRAARPRRATSKCAAATSSRSTVPASSTSSGTARFCAR